MLGGAKSRLCLGQRDDIVQRSYNEPGAASLAVFKGAGFDLCFIPSSLSSGSMRIRLAPPITKHSPATHKGSLRVVYLASIQGKTGIKDRTCAPPALRPQQRTLCANRRGQTIDASRTTIFQVHLALHRRYCTLQSTIPPRHRSCRHRTK